MLPIKKIILEIEARSWKRTTGSYRRIMTDDQRAYYNQLYASMSKSGIGNYGNKKLGAKFIFALKRKGSMADIDNLVKAFFDAGQPSKWMKGRHVMTPPDFWNDRQFSHIEAYRIMGAKKDMIHFDLYEMTKADEDALYSILESVGVNIPI